MTARKRGMCLRLSEDESDQLRALAAELGMPQVSLIRQWIRDHAAARVPHGTMPPPEELYRQLKEVFGPKMRRR